MTKRQAIIAFITGVLILGLYTVNILFTDGLRFSKGSYEYWVTISSNTIKSFPVLGSVNEPTYFYSSRDGPSPSVQEITYISSYDEVQLTQKIDVFLSEQGFKNENNFYVKGDDEISVTYLRNADNSVEVNALLTRQ